MPSLPTSRENNFDCMRLVAAITVLYAHCQTIYRLPDTTPIEYLGQIGVSVFFIISGYFVTASWQRHRELLSFMRNRALRIFPALCGLIFLTVFLLGPSVTVLPLREYFGSSQTFRYLGWSFLIPLENGLPGVFDHHFLHAVNASLWTLPVEFMCYCAVALLGMRGLLRPYFLLFLFVALWFSSRYALSLKSSSPEMLRAALDLVTLFAGGSFMYLARTFIPLRKELFALAILLMIASAYWWGKCVLFDVASIYGVIYFGFLKIPLLGGFARYGDFSYGVYLYGWPAQQVIAGASNSMDFVYFFGASLLVSGVCALLSWHLIEKPSLAHRT